MQLFYLKAKVVAWHQLERVLTLPDIPAEGHHGAHSAIALSGKTDPAARASDETLSRLASHIDCEDKASFGSGLNKARASKFLSDAAILRRTQGMTCYLGIVRACSIIAYYCGDESQLGYLYTIDAPK